MNRTRHRSIVVPLAVFVALTLAPASIAANAITDGDTAQTPLLSFPIAGFRLSAPVMVSGRAESVSGYPVDVAGHEMAFQPLGLLLQTRVGVRIESKKMLEPFFVSAEAEAEARNASVPDDAAALGAGVLGEAYRPGSTFLLRKAYVKGAFANFVQISAGAQMSHWGLGLIANDAAHGWEPGSARFSDPVGGDRVLRGTVSTAPKFGALTLMAMVGADWVLGDDTLVIAGDRAYQAFIATQLSSGKDLNAGIYAVRRHQDEVAFGTTDVWVVDGAFHTNHVFSLGRALKLDAGIDGEGAMIFGESSLAPNLGFAKQDVMQLGGAVRAHARLGAFGVVVDGIYASGDQNLEDNQQNAFRTDPNFETGVLLFRQVQAAVSGNVPRTAGDPALVGKPAPGLGRAPLRGAISNTVAVFPRLLVVPTSGVEIYGGPLLAFAPAKPVDPLQSRLVGGSVRNAYAQSPGQSLGTELDLGTRLRFMLSSAELIWGFEGAVLFPGDAYLTSSGNLDPIYGARSTLTARY